MNTEGRERFFRAIAERIDVERVEEVHVFPAIRQGGRESGVAVLTLRPLPAEGEVVQSPGAAEDVDAQDAVEGGDAIDAAESADAIADGDAGAITDADAIVDGDADTIADADATADAEAIADGDADEITLDVVLAEGTDVVDDAAGAEVVDDTASAEEESAASPPTPPPPRRFTVLRAHYRLQLKGPDRGKWEVSVVEEADAPAATVDEVVRGVHERAGGWSVEGPERLTGEEFRAALVEVPWSATR